MDGLALAARIRESLSERMPKMFMLAKVTSADRDFWERVGGAGFGAILTKPAKTAKLVNAFVGASARAEGATGLGEDAEADASDGGALSILLVDDNRINLKVGQKLLRKIGHEVDLAGSGSEAIDRCVALDYDVVLMDIEMPGMDGLETAARIRERAAHDHRPYIVALTANAMVSDRESYLQAGMDDYLSKPIDEEALVASLDSAARFRRAQRRGEPPAG